MEKSYLIQQCKDEISELISAKREQYHSITISLTTLKQSNTELYNGIKTNLSESLGKWNKALLETQYDLVESGSVFLEENYSIKQSCFVHFNKLPEEDDILNDKFPTTEHHRELIQISGKIVRKSKVYNYQKKRKYICSKCKEAKIIESTYEENYNFPVQAMKCKNLANNCRGTYQPDLINFPPEYFIKYQECRIQETSCTDIKKSIPKSITVSLENDLVDTCDPGEFVSICGVYELQWRPFNDNKRIESKFYLNAIGIIKDENKMILQKNYSENIICAKSQWYEDIENVGQLNARNLLINSICPEICDTYIVKLAIALALSSCYRNFNNKEITKRGHSHLLLIGDPGVGKSRFLEAAAQLALRSASTTGLGSTNAGLTAACIQENGSYHLEAGALVLADNGVCCIDEFNLLQENDRTSIHEALEQQEINIAKAGILAKLNTRCVVVAAANPKCLTSFQENCLNSSNIGIASPLLSRFDLVLILKNERNLELDRNIAMRKLNSTKDESCWTAERLKSHFLASNEIQPEISEAAKKLILQYYLICRQDEERDRARTTIRLQDSLNRLAQAHTRLMLRNKVLGIDVILVIKLMEASYSFGRLFCNRISMNKLDEIGPTENEVIEVLNKLNLIEVQDDLLKELHEIKEAGIRVQNIEESQEEKQQRLMNFEAEFGFRKERLQKNSDEHDENMIISLDNLNVTKDLIMENEDEHCILSLLNSSSSDDIAKGHAETNKNEEIKYMDLDFEEIEPVRKPNENSRRSPIAESSKNFSFTKKLKQKDQSIQLIDLELDGIELLKKANNYSKPSSQPGCSKEHLKSGDKSKEGNENIKDIDFNLNDILPRKKANNNAKCSPQPGCSKDSLESTERNKINVGNIKLMDFDLDANELLNSLPEKGKNNKFLPKGECSKYSNEINTTTSNKNLSKVDDLLLQMDSDDEFELNIEHIDEVIASSEKENVNKKQPLQSNRNSEKNKLNDDEFLLNLEDLDDTEISPKDVTGSSKKRNLEIDDIENFEIESFLSLSANKKSKVLDNYNLNKNINKTSNLTESNRSQALIDERNELKKQMSLLNDIEASKSEWKTLHCTQQAKENYLRDKAKKRSEFLTNITESELTQLLDFENFSTFPKSKK